MMTSEVQTAIVDVTARQVVRELERGMGLAAKDLARALDTNTRTVERWMTGETIPRKDARHRLAMLFLLSKRLGETFQTPEDVQRWLSTPSAYLGGIRPMVAVQGGELDRVEEALEAIDSGIYL